MNWRDSPKRPQNWLVKTVCVMTGTSCHCVNYVVRQHRQTQFDIFMVHKEYKVSDSDVGVPSATTVNVPFFKLWPQAFRHPSLEVLVASLKAALINIFYINNGSTVIWTVLFMVATHPQTQTTEQVNLQWLPIWHWPLQRTAIGVPDLHSAVTFSWV